MAGLTWNEFERVVREYLPEVDDETPLTEESSLMALGLDSLAALELICHLEDGYEINLGDDAFDPSTLATAGTLWTLVRHAAASLI